MKKYNHIKNIVKNQSDLSLDKPETITDEEWIYYNQMELLENDLQIVKSNLFYAKKRIETLKALHGEF